MSQEKAWVLVGPDGKVLWWYAHPKRGQCIEMLVQNEWAFERQASDEWRLLEKLHRSRDEHLMTRIGWMEEAGYTFARVAVIPDGCKVCRQRTVPRHEQDFQNMTPPWEPIDEGYEVEENPVEDPPILF